MICADKNRIHCLFAFTYYKYHHHIILLAQCTKMNSLLLYVNTKLTTKQSKCRDEINEKKVDLF